MILHEPLPRDTLLRPSGSCRQISWTANFDLELRVQAQLLSTTTQYVESTRRNRSDRQADCGRWTGESQSACRPGIGK
jgi:hypothetical protein